ncbi:MAG: RNA polymerase sigma-70 factor [Rikenellaceae bacterium]|jgi:RNA polymerase sigma-70 factor (ECF subfamily)|nr:RNA polymerase sigma-70 factor [Rikenellaceae bacterium]
MGAGLVGQRYASPVECWRLLSEGGDGQRKPGQDVLSASLAHNGKSLSFSREKPRRRMEQGGRGTDTNSPQERAHVVFREGVPARREYRSSKCAMRCAVVALPSRATGLRPSSVVPFDAGDGLFGQAARTKAQEIEDSATEAAGDANVRGILIFQIQFLILTAYSRNGAPAKAGLRITGSGFTGKQPTMTPPRDDITLLELVAGGDEAAFKELFDGYFLPLCRYMYLYVNDKSAAEDMTTDIFMNLWAVRGKLRIHTSFKSYLFRAARNRCLNFMRDNRRNSAIDGIDQGFDDDSFLEAEELSYIIEKAVSGLPDKCREVYTLSREQELTNREIADRLKISIKTVEAQIGKALRNLRKLLREYY